MQAPDAAVGRVGAALEQAAGLEPVGEAGDGDGLDLEQLGELLLGEAGLAVEADQHDPLRAGHAVGAGAAVGFGAEHAADVVDKDQKVGLVVGHGAYESSVISTRGAPAARPFRGRCIRCRSDSSKQPTLSGSSSLGEVEDHAGGHHREAHGEHKDDTEEGAEHGAARS